MPEELEGTYTLEQRVQIAKDVIARLQAGTIVTSTSWYLLPEGGNEISQISGTLDSGSLGACKVCARGAIFLSAIDRYNSVKVKRGENLDAVAAQRSREGLGTNQAEEIELAFQIWESDRGPKDRLIAICQNMIDNGGLFIPPAMEEYEPEDFHV